MTRRILLLLASFTLLSTAPGLAPDAAAQTGAGVDIGSSVVQVFVQSSAVDVFSPWERQGVTAGSGSGVIIEGRRILTAAHVVTDDITIEVKRRDHTRKYPARVEYLAHDCDLAVLTVEDASFFDGSRPVALGDNPRIEDQVKVYGFPEGGDTVSATSGIVSRVEIATYTHSWRDLLVVQVDAAINSGNSGGPVISAGRLAGIAMQSLGGAENIGYIIPAEIVKHLLDDIADGRYDGFPDLDLSLQSLENEALRDAYGLADDETGALVTEVGFGSAAHGVISPEDVILSVDGLPIAEDLTVEVPGIGRVRSDYTIYRKQVGEAVPLTLLRKGRRIEAKLTAGNPPSLVPGNFTQYGRDYFVFGGLVFQPLTRDYLYYSKMATEGCYNTDLDYYVYYHNFRTPDRDQVVLLSKVLPAPLNRGYQRLVDVIVGTVQGERVRDLGHLVRLMEEAEGQRLKIVMETGEIVILDLPRARRENGKILEVHKVLSDRSEALK